MINKEHFLSQSYRDAWKDFEYSLYNEKARCWDWIIVTASNERQAESYRIQIRKRIKEKIWPVKSKWMVVPDLGGERIGSGGATLNVLNELAKQMPCEDINKMRILILHSGGDSKRIPQYSACGKLFSPVPRCMPNGVRSTVFDELLVSVAGIPARIDSGMLVLPGDTEVLFNPLQLDLQGCDAAGLSMKASVNEGKEHGVFVCNSENRVIDYFLHKQSEKRLRELGAVDSYDNVDIDTGCIWIGKRVLSELINLISEDGAISQKRVEKYVNSKVCLSFYADIVYPLAKKSTLEQYYFETPEGSFSDELTECRTEIWNALSKYDIEIMRLTPSKYIHYGTTHELYRFLVWDLDNYKFLDWRRDILSNVRNLQGARNNALIHENSCVHGNSYIEDSVIGENVVVNKDVILSNVKLDDEEIPSDAVLHCLPIEDGGYICRIYGINDNPKNSADGSFLTSTLHKFMKKYNIGFEEIWDGGVPSIWNAKLYTKENSMKEAVGSALMLYNMICNDVDETIVDSWKNKERYSLNESYNIADMHAILEWQSAIEEMVKIQNFVNGIKEGKELADVLSSCGLVGIDSTLIDKVKSVADREEFPNNMRLYLALSDMLKKAAVEEVGDNSSYYEDKAYEVVRNSIIEAVTREHKWDESKCGFKTDCVEVSLPVRVNFCGSPSDAAPYCLEHGGTMLDAALLLKGEMPIKVIVRRLDEPVIILESFDLNSIKKYENIEEVRECNNPYDTFALHKAVLVASGLIPNDIIGVTLADICNMIGGGLYLSTSVDVPKGSGLGTSSIVAAACIKAVREILGQDVGDDTIYAQVFLAEQLMTTGGGWQDQVGGLNAGLKLFHSQPGIYQKIDVEFLKLPEHIERELDERFVLIFSGQRRLARNVLREEMNQCIRNDKVAMESIERIRQVCMLMKYQLDRGNVTEFGKCLSEQFELVKKLDKGASNTCIEYIFDVCDDLIDGKSICGAGGGGFLQVILKEGVTKEDLTKRIDSEFLDCGVKVWDCNILF